MAEYIEREVLLKRIENSISSWGRDCNSNAPLMVRAYQDVLHRVKTTPTADVQEVKHGEWKAEGDCGITRCSVCGWTIEECIEDNYCRNCGAKMDGDANGNL